jgi:glycerol-3-phosphate acyltransferase PlsY
MTWLLFMIAAFLAGSIPTGLWIARSRGVDLRKHGSGNIGATNVGRVLGPRLGLICFAIDVLKGFAPTLAAGIWFDLVDGPQPPARDAWLWLGVMACTVLGHMFTPLAGFKGGKGVATGLGALLGVYPYLTVPAIGALAMWAGVLAIWRYVGLASIAAALALPVLVVAWAAYRAVFVHRLGDGELLRYRSDWLPFVVVVSLLSGAVLVRHRSNIRRMLEGREHRLGGRTPPPGPPPAAPAAPPDNPHSPSSTTRT